MHGLRANRKNLAIEGEILEVEEYRLWSIARRNSTRTCHYTDSLASKTTDKHVLTDAIEANANVGHAANGVGWSGCNRNDVGG